MSVMSCIKKMKEEEEGTTTVRKVCDIQNEIYSALPRGHHVEIKNAIHEREWDKAENLMTDEMAHLYNRVQQIKEARKIVRRIRR